MSYLIDTRVLLWAAWESPRLSEKAEAIIRDTSNGVSVSITSLWEIAIKLSMGKLSTSLDVMDLISYCEDQSISIASLSNEAVVCAAGLSFPTTHKNPFDRIIACTCLIHRYVLISADTAFDAYGLQRIW